MIVMLFVLSNCFRTPIPIFRTPAYEFRTLSGCAVKMYQICCFVLLISQKKGLVINMAITKIHPIKSTLNLAIDYIT